MSKKKDLQIDKNAILREVFGNPMITGEIKQLTEVKLKIFSFAGCALEGVDCKDDIFDHCQTNSVQMKWR